MLIHELKLNYKSEVIREQLPEIWNLAVEGIKKELKD
jgi:hypothetical protein